MIKLTDLLNEIYIEKPESPDDDLMSKGFKLGEPEIDPETGTTTTTVTYLPKLKQTRVDLYKMRDQFRQYKYFSNPNIAKLAKEISTSFT